jgi:hypothetical protein
LTQRNLPPCSFKIDLLNGQTAYSAIISFLALFAPFHSTGNFSSRERQADLLGGPKPFPKGWCGFSS